MNNIYEPKSTPAPVAQTSEYVLVNDVTGEEPIKRGPQTLTDTKGYSVKVPYPPKVKCNKCYGRGFIGSDPIKKRLLLCLRCYPQIKK